MDARFSSAVARNPDAWLYFYEDFLEVYDNKLRKQTGSYYTPPEVVAAMVRLVDEALRSRFALHSGLASPAVTLADPAVGTGTFMLGMLRRIAETVAADEGPGAVPVAIDVVVKRLLAFEIQLGPFAVAQLRILAELADLIGNAPTTPLRMFVTDTLGNPYIEQEWVPAILGPIAESRRRANEIKRQEPITVVIGNPPYKEKAKNRGGWVESGSKNSPEPPPLAEYTSELINLLNVIGLLTGLEHKQAELLEQICAAQTISIEELRAAGALIMSATSASRTGTQSSSAQLGLLDQQ
jgi:N-6 DNA Methylase